MFSPTQIRRICIAIVCVMYSLSAFADRGADHRELHRKITLHYTFDSAEIDENLQENRNNLFSLKSILRDSVRIDSITIISHASPDGGYPHNIKLARERGLVLKNFILNECSDSVRLTSDRIILKDGAENWQGLTDMVDSRYSRHDREKVLRILADTSVGPETRKWRLKQLDGGYTWNFLYRRYMPVLRQAVITGISYSSFTPLVACLPTETMSGSAHRMPENSPGIALAYDGDDRETAGEGGFVFAVKTNLLYDAALVPNIGVEANIGKGWAATAGWNYAWWDSDAVHRYWRVYGGEAEVRKYFGKTARKTVLSGHHLGLYGQAFTYDFELGGRGQISELTYGGGIAYGYALPVGRSFNLDFSIGLGYLGGEYKIYDPEDGCYVWKETRQRHWMGPTKAEVSLVWVIGRKGQQWEKGGRR